SELLQHAAARIRLAVGGIPMKSGSNARSIVTMRLTSPGPRAGNGSPGSRRSYSGATISRDLLVAFHLRRAARRDRRVECHGPLHQEAQASKASQQTDEDLRAIFAFLQAVPPVAHRVDNTLPATRCPLCGGMHGAGDQNVVRDRQ